MPIVFPLLDPKSAPLTLALLNNAIDKPFKDINQELKVVNTGLSKYSKALDKVQWPLTICFPTTG